MRSLREVAESHVRALRAERLLGDVSRFVQRAETLEKDLQWARKEVEAALKRWISEEVQRLRAQRAEEPERVDPDFLPDHKIRRDGRGRRYAAE
mgnify:CR=1 FL=1